MTALTGVADEQIMWRVRNFDDEQAFAALVRRWEGRVLRLCVRMTGNNHRGEDLAQETFARVFSKRGQYEPSGQFSTWLWRIALNLCYDELRRRARRPEASLDDETLEDAAGRQALTDPEPGPDGLLMEQERGELVRQALMRLPEHYRSVLVLRHYEDLKFREIAEVLGVPEGTIKSRMAEGLNQIGRLLKPAFSSPPGSPSPRPQRESLML